MGLFDVFKKKNNDKKDETEDDIVKYNLSPNHTYFVPSGLSSNGVVGKVRFGVLKVGDYCKMADNSTDFIIEVAEMYDLEGKPVTEAADGQQVSIYAKVNGRGFRGYGIFEKIE
ncbi:MAG: hypothetical protein K6F92_06865 [Lachnospiraceae bacterium]|nr:hypothetical protein [Lachnospiraceae bacterium]